MTLVLAAIGVVICIGLILSGHLVAVLAGGFIGSFVGIAGFGGAVSGMIPGAIVGAILAIALSKKNDQQIK